MIVAVILRGTSPNLKCLSNNLKCSRLVGEMWINDSESVNVETQISPIQLAQVFPNPFMAPMKSLEGDGMQRNERRMREWEKRGIPWDCLVLCCFTEALYDLSASLAWPSHLCYRQNKTKLRAPALRQPAHPTPTKHTSEGHYNHTPPNLWN